MHYLPNRRFLFGAIFCVLSGYALAVGAAKNPMQKIETPHFSIGFRQNHGRVAQRVANTLETLYVPVYKTLGCPPRPIRVLLNNWSVSSGGHFMPFPRHLAFQTFDNSDPYFVGNEHWIDLLCIHEFRHAAQDAVQYDNTPKLLRPFCVAFGFFPYMGIPRFFSEGDAIGVETALSQYGRGRSPSWSNLYKATLLERGICSFEQALCGSFRHPQPDEYRLGYYFTTYIRTRYGAEALQAIYAKTMRTWGGFFGAVEATTQKTVQALYQDMSQALLRDWQEQLEGLPLTPAQLLRARAADGDDLVHYLHPYIDDSGTVFAWKSGLGTRHQLVAWTPGSAPLPTETVASPTAPEHVEARRFFTGCLLGEGSGVAVALGKDCAAWLEPCLHPWRGMQEGENCRQIVRLQWYDLKKRKRRTLAAQCRYNALAISPSTRQLVAVESSASGEQHLVVLNSRNGKVTHRLPNPDGASYATPSWWGETHLLVMQIQNHQNQLVRLSVASGAAEVLLPLASEHRCFPKWCPGDYVLYNSSYNGIDNIYALHLPTKACFQVTSRKYGAYFGHVYPKGDRLLFCDCTKQGMRLAVMPFRPSDWTPLEQVEVRTVSHYAPLVQQEGDPQVLDRVPNRTYPVAPYRWWKDGLACTGSYLKAVDLSKRALNLSLLSLLDLDFSLKISPYISYVFSEVSENQVKASVGVRCQYYSSYPVFHLDLGAAERKLREPFGSAYAWDRLCTFGLAFPYYFTRAAATGKVEFRPEIRWSSAPQDCTTTAYHFLVQQASTFSERDLVPPWHQRLSLEVCVPYGGTTLDQVNQGLSLEQGWTVRVPGLWAHHFLELSPRYKGRVLRSKIKDDTEEIQLTYGLPIAYPDRAMPLGFFLKRIHIQGYYGFQRNWEPGLVREGAAHYDPLLYGPMPPPSHKDVMVFGLSTHCLTHWVPISRSLFAWKPVLHVFLRRSGKNPWKLGFQLSFGL